MTLNIHWIDEKREPKCATNPAYPAGMDIVQAKPGQKSCTVALPYPAKRCGMYLVDCPTCKMRVAVSTAGRPDDPRSLTVACKETVQ